MIIKKVTFHAKNKKCNSLKPVSYNVNETDDDTAITKAAIQFSEDNKNYQLYNSTSCEDVYVLD